MSEEKKEEKKEKPQTVVKELSTIQVNLSEALKTQEAISMSVSKVMVDAVKPLESIRQSLQIMQSFNNGISAVIQQQQAAMRALQTPAVFEAMRLYQTQVLQLSNILTDIRRMTLLSTIPIPKITTGLNALPSQNKRTIEGLLRHIAFLEKELAKEKAENKELLRLLDEKRKELKKQYIV